MNTYLSLIVLVLLFGGCQKVISSGRYPVMKGKLEELGTQILLLTFLLAGLFLCLAGAARAASFAYISNWAGRTVSVIDTSSNTVVATVPVPFFPEGVAVHPSGTRVYVGDSFGSDVSVIDTATNTVTATFPCGSSNFTHGLAVNPAGTRLYMASLGKLCVIDTDPSSPTYHTVIDTLVAGSVLWGVAINPSGSQAYVTDSLFGNVLVIDTATNTVVDTVGLGMVPQVPEGVVVNPSETRVYVANDSGGGSG